MPASVRSKHVAFHPGAFRNRPKRTLATPRSSVVQGYTRWKRPGSDSRAASSAAKLGGGMTQLKTPDTLLSWTVLVDGEPGPWA